jgi:hypothetical protein
MFLVPLVSVHSHLGCPLLSGYLCVCVCVCVCGTGGFFVTGFFKIGFHGLVAPVGFELRSS